MSDSEKNELDSYGVWVKKPPRTIDSSMEESATSTGEQEIDDANDTALSMDELAAISDNTEMTDATDEFISGGTGETEGETPAEPTSGGEMEDISLDEFGFDDSDSDAEGENSETAEETSASDARDDAGSDEIVIKDNSDAADMDSDGPINIDLSFDDTPESAPAQGFAATDDGTESVDLSEFGFSDDSAEDSSAGGSTNDDGTENVDLSEFGFSDGDSETGAAEETTAESAAEGGGDATEDVDLSEFGFDGDSEESETPKAADEDDGEIKMTVVADEDEFDDTESAAETSTESKTGEDSDFDVDSIMNSVQDENGNTVGIPDSTEDFAEQNQDDTFEITSEDRREAENFSLEEPLFNDSEDAEDEIEEPAVSDGEEDGKIEEPKFSDFGEDALSEDEDEEEDFVPDSIPDTFDEETASLMGEDANSASAPAAANSETNAILSQIVSQLSSLKDEISNIKQDVESMKKAPRAEAAKAEPEAADEGGFFSSSEEEDDTIALSLDELDNILSTTEIVPVPEDGDDTEIPAQGLDAQGGDIEAQEDTLGIADSTLESVISKNPEGFADDTISDDEVDTSRADAADSEADDVIVESSSSPMSEISEGEEAEKIAESAETEPEPAEGEVQAEPALADEPETEESALDGFSFDEPEAEPNALVDDSATEDLSEIGAEMAAAETEDSVDLPEDGGKEAAEQPAEDDSFAVDGTGDYMVPDESGIPAEDTSIEDSLTDSNLDYLTSDPALAEEEKQEESAVESIPSDLKSEIKSVLSYMDQLLENLPEEKIAEFAQSEQFETYKKLFKELGLA